MRLSGRLKLGFYPLSIKEAERLRSLLSFPDQFSALDPCVGNGAAFKELLGTTCCRAYAIEVDAYRAEQARSLGVEVVQANALHVRCPAEAFSLLYLNPPYDFEVGRERNKRLELVFLEHTFRWLKQKGVLVYVLPQAQLRTTAKLLAEHFVDLRVYRLTEPESLRYNQVAVIALRRPRAIHPTDSQVEHAAEHLRRMAEQGEIPSIDNGEPALYPIPVSGPVSLVNQGIPLDELEDLLPDSSVI